MKRLKLYFIDNEYIEYLRKYDNRVAFNKMPSRPYIGVVYLYHNFTYFAPLSSPKPKHLLMNNNIIDLFKIENGKLGVINLNNMIPCTEKVLTEAIPIVNDKKYKILLENQLNYINANRDILFKKTARFQEKYRQGYLYYNIMNRCCDFPLLEEKCLVYKK